MTQKINLFKFSHKYFRNSNHTGFQDGVIVRNQVLVISSERVWPSFVRSSRLEVMVGIGAFSRIQPVGAPGQPPIERGGKLSSEVAVAKLQSAGTTAGFSSLFCVCRGWFALQGQAVYMCF